jgi:hypothetical protein
MERIKAAVNVLRGRPTMAFVLVRLKEPVELLTATKTVGCQFFWKK